jgi:hypothetical protein
MKITKILARLRRRPAARPQSLDVTASWTAREWADLPVHHPRAN